MVGTQSLQGGARDNAGRGYPGSQGTGSQGTGSQGHHHGASAAGKRAFKLPAMRAAMAVALKCKHAEPLAAQCLGLLDPVDLLPMLDFWWVC